MPNTKNDTLTVTIISILFVVLYGSGFVGAKLGFPFAHPLVFLVWRFAISTVLLLLLAFFTKAPWPKTWKQAGHIAVSGIFLVCMFSIGTWVSMDMGVPPAISALIIALQPLAVAIASYFILKKEILIMQWIGFMLGLMGVVLVVGGNASFNMHYLAGILMSVIGLLGLTIGNLYQKQFCAYMNIFSGGVIQSVVSGIVSLVLALCFEPMAIQWTGQFIFALLWMSVIVSLGAISFLYILLRKGESPKVASIFYLVPAVTAIISYFVFKTTLDFYEIMGMLVVMIGVGMVNIKFKKHYQMKEV